MHSHRILAPAVSLFVCVYTLVQPASAQSQPAGQSFEERWSIIPNAKADDVRQPAPAPQAPAVAKPSEPAAAEARGQSGASVSSPRRQSRAAVSSPGAAPRHMRHSRQNNSPKGAFAGKASYISYAGGTTASGAPYRPQALTAAHRTLPFGTRLRVTDVKTGRQVRVTVNDRGPFVRNRILDLSRGAAQVLGMADRGV